MGGREPLRSDANEATLKQAANQQASATAQGLVPVACDFEVISEFTDKTHKSRDFT